MPDQVLKRFTTPTAGPLKSHSTEGESVSFVSSFLLSFVEGIQQIRSSQSVTRTEIRREGLLVFSK